MDEAKPFKIPKREVWEAFKKIKANQGAAGVDGQSIAAFEANLSGNLYKLWNRLSSGSYFPPPVRRVDIPKANGETRPLGVPTVADRIAQMVVKRRRSRCRAASYMRSGSRCTTIRIFVGSSISFVSARRTQICAASSFLALSRSNSPFSKPPIYDLSFS